MTTCSAVKVRPALCPGARTLTISKLSDIVLEWRDGRRKRRIAARLDDRTLRDIGLTRLQVTYREARRHGQAAHRWS